MVPATVTRPPAKALMTGDVSEPSGPGSRVATWRPPAARERERDDCRPGYRDRAQHRPALPDDVPDRPGERHGDHGADAEGREEQGERARVTAEPFSVDGREQHDRKGEHRHVEIREKGAGQHLVAAD